VRDLRRLRTKRKCVWHVVRKRRGVFRTTPGGKKGTAGAKRGKGSRNFHLS